MKQAHPADIAGAAIIAAAVRFDVALFIGRGKYAHASARTLAEARDVAAPALEAEHPYGRRALIYAIDAAGRQALVPAGYRPPHRHDDPDGLPEVLCRKCHPELSLTPEERQELEAAELARQEAERAEEARRREIEKAKTAPAKLLKRGDPEANPVQGRIAAALRNKLARLQAPIPSAIARQGEPAMKIYAKKFNAERAAKAAGHSLDAIEIVKAKGGFAWRLKTQPKPDPRDAKLAPDPSREPRPATASKRARPLGKRAQIEAEARAGKLGAPSMRSPARLPKSSA